MNALFFVIICFLLLVLILMVYFFRTKSDSNNELRILQDSITQLQGTFSRIEQNLKQDFQINRQEISSNAKSNRDELNNTLREVKETISLTFKDFQATLENSIKLFNEVQREKFTQLELKQAELIKHTESKLEHIRHTVEEKLEKTLSERIGQSFETVGKQLNEVQKGLGEMQNLAQDVGGLKKALTNVKRSGVFGEFQLSMLLEQIMSPNQYSKNVTIKNKNSVEFAINLPGKDEHQKELLLPIDAKFPREPYERLLAAYESTDNQEISNASKNLEVSIRKMSRDISEKYIDPPNTTDFAILFLPFEGLFAEVVRNPQLLEDIHINHKVIITGPTTLGAILSSLQIGFRTLAVEKKSSEVWKILSNVKKEFETFEGLLNKAHENIKSGLDKIDELSGKRTRAIIRDLKEVQTLDEFPSSKLEN